jgi:hypothetical protein
MRRAAVIAAALAVAAIFFAGQQRNPPGFAQDESSIAFNAYELARHGVDEYGVAHPLYFKAFGEYKNPLYIYLLAGEFKCVPPSNLAARRLSASLGIAAVFALAWLAWVLSGSAAVAVVTMLTAAATPNLFEISRLAFEVAAYPLALALFLLAAYAAFRRERWSAALVLALAGTLIAMTYAYSIGRLHAPLLLAWFACLTVNRRRWLPLAAVIAIYAALAIAPLAVFNATHANALTERFRRLSYIPALREHPVELIAAVGSHAAQNLNPIRYSLTGDPNPRHHVEGGGGSMLLATFVLAVIGAAVTLPRRDRWWWFVAGGAVLSVVPAILTSDVAHSLRLVPYPLFLIVLSIPALQWFRVHPWPIAILLILGLAQALWFFHAFATRGPARTNEFDAGFRHVFNGALAPGAPLYVSHSVFMQAYWYGAQRGLERSAFQVTWDPATAPPGSVVVGDETPCNGCEVVGREGRFSAWRTPKAR